MGRLWLLVMTNLATVDNTGKITAMANITVKTADGAKTAVCALTVTAPAEG